MEVILRQDVDSLGLRGDVVNVARGYARNFLLPRGLAQAATPALVRELEKRDQQRARHEAKTADEAKAIADRIGALELRFDVNAGPTGSLFGSVTATNVADRLWDEAKIRVDRRKLEMDTIKRIGRYRVPVALFADVTAELSTRGRPRGPGAPDRGGARRARGRRGGRRRSRGRGGRGPRGRGDRARSGRGRSGRGRGGRARGRGRAGRRTRVGFPQALHRPVDELSTAVSTGPSTACGTRVKVLAPSVLFVHLAERTPVLIFLHKSVPEECERRFAHG